MQQSALAGARAALFEREKADFAEKVVSKGELKGNVTPGDHESENVVRALLAELAPAPYNEAKFLGEETADIAEWRSSGKKGLYWVTDPVDGTNAFIRGKLEAERPVEQRTWAVSIGLQEDGRDLAGLIYLTDADKDSAGSLNGRLFWAIPGKGAFTAQVDNNNIGKTQPLKRTNPIFTPDGTVAMGQFLSDYPEYRFDGLNRIGPVSSGIISKAFPGDERSGLKHVHSACAEMMNLALGKRSVYAHGRHCPWDVAAAYPILKEAGFPLAEYRASNGDEEFSALVAARAPEIFRSINRVYDEHSAAMPGHALLRSGNSVTTTSYGTSSGAAAHL